MKKIPDGIYKPRNLTLEERLQIKTTLRRRAAKIINEGDKVYQEAKRDYLYIQSKTIYGNTL